jgi:hypothetical protein
LRDGRRARESDEESVWEGLADPALLVFSVRAVRVVKQDDNIGSVIQDAAVDKRKGRRDDDHPSFLREETLKLRLAVAPDETGG